MELEDLVEEKQKTCNEKLRDWRRRNAISEETYLTLQKFNDTLAREIGYSIHVGDSLLKDRVISSIDELLTLTRVASPTEIIAQMFNIISGKLGRTNPAIRGAAADLSRTIRQGLGDFDSDVLGEHYGLTNTYCDRQDRSEEVTLKPRDLNRMKVCADIANSIYEYVWSNFEYINEDRFELLQAPLSTMKVVKGGDCDDLSMLLCSLWESIGFETTLNFLLGSMDQPAHVFPGVKLVIPTSSKKVAVFNILADPSLKGFQMFDLSYKLSLSEIEGAPSRFSTFLQSVKSHQGEGTAKMFENLYKNAKCYTVPPVKYPKFRQVVPLG